MGRDGGGRVESAGGGGQPGEDHQGTGKAGSQDLAHSARFGDGHAAERIITVITEYSFNAN